MQRQIFNSDSAIQGRIAKRVGALLAMTGFILLSACSGSNNSVTENNLRQGACSRCGEKIAGIWS